MIKRICFFLMCSIFLSGVFTSCSGEDEGHTLLSGAYVLEASAQTNMGEVSLPVSGDQILIKLPKSVALEEITLNIKVSEGAKIYPDPAQIRDWSYNHVFTVTAEDGTTRTYFSKPQLEDMGKVFPGSVRLKSQQEINGFGSNGFTSVGDLYIYQESPNDPISDFSALNSIVEIKGQLVINRITGRKVELPNLERLGDFLLHAPTVTTVRMPKLKFVAENFIIGHTVIGQLPEAHPDMSEVSLNSLEYVGQSLKFNFTSKIRSLESLSNLKYIGKDLTILGGTFASLKGLEGIEYLQGTFELAAGLQSLEGFNMKEIQGNLLLRNIENVSSTAPLSSLEKIGNGLIIANNRYIQTLEGIQNIEVPYVQVENLLGLMSLDGMPVQAQMREVYLASLPEVASVSVLSPLNSVSGRLTLYGIGKLKSLSGLENLVQAGQLVFINNQQLESLDGLSPDLVINDRFDVTNSPLITSLSQLSSITKLGALYLRGLTGLTTLEGLENLTEITNGGVFIESNRNLTDISALSNLKQITFYTQQDKLSLRGNSILQDFCPVSDLILRYAPVNRVTLSTNYYNPTLANFQNGACSGGTGGSGIGGGRG